MSLLVMSDPEFRPDNHWTDLREPHHLIHQKGRVDSAIPSRLVPIINPLHLTRDK